MGRRVILPYWLQDPCQSSPILNIITDRGDTNRVGGEHESIGLDRCVADIAEALRHALRGAVAKAEEVEITGCACAHLRPGRQEHRALEYERIPMVRYRQAIKEPLECVPLQNVLELLPCRRRDVQKARMDRRGDVRHTARVIGPGSPDRDGPPSVPDRRRRPGSGRLPSSCGRADHLPAPPARHPARSCGGTGSSQRWSGPGR